jgi:uncharacterized protein involved in exopolysaccharide biosynthesis
MEDNRDYYSLQDVINTLKVFITYLRRKWWLLVLAIIAGGGLGAVYYFWQKPKYEAVTTFILEDKSSSNNGLAGLASQFGFNLGSLSGGGNMFAGDNILTILKSKKVMEQVLLNDIDTTSHNEKSLADYYLEFSGVKKSWKNSKVPIDFTLSNLKKRMDPKEDSILNDICHTIAKKNMKVDRVSKQGNIIQVKVTSRDCLFSRLLSERLVEEASKLYLEVKTSTLQNNVDQLQSRSDSLLYFLNRKSYSAAMSQQLDFNPGIKSAIVPVEIANRDKAVLGALYAEVTKNLELGKLMLAQQTPVIQVLDKSPELLSDNKKGLTFLILVFSFLSFVFFFLLLSVAYFLKGDKKT